MSLELTDEERALVKDKTVIGAAHEFAVMLTIILKLQARVMRLGFYADHPQRLDEHNRLYCGPCAAANKPDPRHTWTDEQWMDAAQAELSREEKG